MKTFTDKEEYIKALNDYFEEYIEFIDTESYTNLSEDALKWKLAKIIDENNNIEFITPKTVIQAEDLAGLIDEFTDKYYAYRLFNKSFNKFDLLTYDASVYSKTYKIQDLFKGVYGEIEINDLKYEDYTTDFK